MLARTFANSPVPTIWPHCFAYTFASFLPDRYGLSQQEHRQFVRSHSDYVAIVNVEEKDMIATLLAYKMQWSARVISEMYRSRWSTEIFFKGMKQVLHRSDFISYTRKTVNDRKRN